MQGYLVLEDGTVFEGKMDEIVSPVKGELVFYTGMTGYQEVLTDPSYKDQIVVFTYPLIGNYGINDQDFESKKPQVKGVILFQLTEHYSHYKANRSLKDYLQKWNIPYLTNVDTRAVVKQIRSKGTLHAVISKDKQYDSQDKLSDFPIRDVSASEIETFGNGATHIALIDFGFKKSILNSLLKRGCKVSVVPFHQMEKVFEIKPHGIVLSNGPGDPKLMKNYFSTLNQLMKQYPTLGICLGNQLIALSFGGNTTKLRFGHRGANHPVIDQKTGNVFITSQNHSYVVDKKSLEKTPLKLRYTNVNDGSVEGLEHEKLKVMSVQFHPEAHPGPEDASFIFDEFLDTYVAAGREKVYA